MNTKNKFISSTIYLMIGGLLTRTIGFFIKIIYTRIIGTEGVALYAIIMPTYSMLICLVTFALPISLSKLIAENKKRSLKIMKNALFIMFFVNFIIVFIMLFASSFIANNLLNEPRCKNLLIAMSLTLPFISVSAVIKGYFNGKQKTYPYMISNVLEQVLRLILIVIYLPKLMNYGIIHALTGFILLSIISEIFSQIVFSFFMPKKINIKYNVCLDKETSNDILNMSIPIVSGKIIGNIGYFFEPIIITNLLLFSGYKMDYILLEYGAYNAYAIALLTIPGFFINAISQTIIPEISSYNDKKIIKKRSKNILILTFILGFVFSILILLFKDNLLNILYKTNLGSNYIKVLAPFFVLFYLEGIIFSILQARGYSKKTFFISLYGVIIKIISMSILCLCHIGLYGLVISEIINILFIIICGFKELKKNDLI